MKLSRQLGKRGVVWSYIVGGIIAIIVLAVLIGIFTGLIKGPRDSIIKLPGQTEDDDKDGVLNMADLCCKDGNPGEVDSRGCPLDIGEDELNRLIERCKAGSQSRT